MISAQCAANRHHLCRADLNPCSCPCGRPLHPSTALDDVTGSPSSSGGDGLTQLENGSGRDLAGVIPSNPSSPDPTFVEVTEDEVDEWLWMRAEDRFGPGAFPRPAKPCRNLNCVESAEMRSGFCRSCDTDAMTYEGERV